MDSMVVTFPGQSVDEQTAERVRQIVASIDDPRLNKKWTWVEVRILVREREMPVEHVHM